MMRTLVVSLLLGIGLAACEPDAEAPSASALRIEPIPSPAGTHSRTPHLTTDGRGTVYLSWLSEPDAGGAALQYASWDGQAWSNPEHIASGGDWFVNWADFPSLAVDADGRKVAHFLQRNRGDAPYAYDVRLTRASGNSWSAPVTPHRDNTPSEHGFVSMIPWDDGETFVAWLDGRNTAAAMEDHSAMAGHGAGGAMTLRAGWLRADGTMRDVQELDGRTCDCCQTDAVRVGDDIVVAYRDRSETEVRDVSIIRWHDGAWSQPKSVAVDGWEIAGCPVNGPALAAREGRVAAAWYTSAEQGPTVLVALSDDAGASFGSPIALDEGRPLGRLDAVMMRDGTTLVSWLELRENDAALLVRAVLPDGTVREPVHVASTSAARSSGFPRMTATPDGAMIAWTDVQNETVAVKLAHIEASTP